MANPFLTDKNLKNFIESLKLSGEQKNFLLDELPQLDDEERLELLDTLKDVYLLNREEADAIQKIKDNWQK
jgi:hypothetical protein